MRSRSAHSLSLVRYFAFIAWGGDTRRFPQLVLSVVPSREGNDDDGVAVLRLVLRLVLRSVLRPVFRLVSSRFISSHLVRASFLRAVASRKRRRFSSIPSPRLSRASPRQILRPVARCLIRFAHPSRSSSRLASRRPSRSHVVSFLHLVLRPVVRLARCAARLPLILRLRRFVQLILPFSPGLAALVVLMTG